MFLTKTGVCRGTGAVINVLASSEKLRTSIPALKQSGLGCTPGMQELTENNLGIVISEVEECIPS
jgi:hypothetical protein